MDRNNSKCCVKCYSHPGHYDWEFIFMYVIVRQCKMFTGNNHEIQKYLLSSKFAHLTHKETTKDENINGYNHSHYMYIYSQTGVN